MANTYPEDEFDRLATQRSVRGAHREPRRTRPWLIALVLVLVLAPICGIALGKVIGGNQGPEAAESSSAAPAATAVETSAAPTEEATDGPSQSPSSNPSAEPSGQASPEPTAEANLNHLVLVLNGRGTAGFAGQNEAILERAGFGNTAVADYHGGQDPVASTIFYSGPEYAGTARAVAEALGVGEVVEDAELTGGLGAPVVAVVR